jgi:hypothetical protein
MSMTDSNGVDYILCAAFPWRLDTPAKVIWANERKMFRERDWRLGDHCYYKPKNEALQ